MVAKQVATSRFCFARVLNLTAPCNRARGRVSILQLLLDLAPCRAVRSGPIFGAIGCFATCFVVVFGPNSGSCEPSDLACAKIFCVYLKTCCVTIHVGLQVNWFGNAHKNVFDSRKFFGNVGIIKLWPVSPPAPRFYSLHLDNSARRTLVHSQRVCNPQTRFTRCEAVANLVFSLWTRAIIPRGTLDADAISIDADAISQQRRPI